VINKIDGYIIKFNNFFLNKEYHWQKFKVGDTLYVHPIDVLNKLFIINVGNHIINVIPCIIDDKGILQEKKPMGFDNWYDVRTIKYGLINKKFNI